MASAVVEGVKPGEAVLNDLLGYLNRLVVAYGRNPIER